MKNYSEDANRQYHIQTAEGEVGRYVILPGDPGRCEKIAQYLDHPVKIQIAPLGLPVLLQRFHQVGGQCGFTGAITPDHRN